MPKPSPEYIAEQQRLAKIRKQKLQDKAQPSPSTNETNSFIKRPILYIDNFSNGLRIMTYNILAQALIRRTLFPTSGEALKWNKRSTVLLEEFCYYHPDIALLQEVDSVQYDAFWKPKFEELGYFIEYYRFGDKNHGVAILYSKTRFKKAHLVKHIDYDDVDTGVVEPRTVTKNVGVIIQCDFVDNKAKKGITIGTHHLFWHPHGTLERTRQTYVTLKSVEQFYKESGSKMDDYYTFFGGDFNSEPYHSPYLSITRKPVFYDDVAKDVIEESSCHIFGGSDNAEKSVASIEKSAEVNMEKGIIDITKSSVDNITEQSSDDFTNTEKSTGDNASTGVSNNVSENNTAKNTSTKKNSTIIGKAPRGVSTQLSTSPDSQTIQSIITLHNSVPLIATSLYSAGYSTVHKENACYRNEPDFSNWAHTWRGLLDYVLLISPWNGTTNHENPTLDDVSEKGVHIKGYLRMPPRSEMPKEGLPKTGFYPSDHLCMMVVLDLD